MKKFISIFSISFVLFFSCNQHISTNSLTINFDKKELNSLIQKSQNNNARIADPLLNGDSPLCLYGILTSTDGTIYQSVNYDIPDITSGEGEAYLSFDRLAINFTYNLNVFLVSNGQTIYEGELRNFQIKNDDITYLNVVLNEITDFNLYLDPIVINVINQNETGNIKINKINPDTAEKQYVCNADKNAFIEFYVNESTGHFEDYSYSAYILTDNSEIPLNTTFTTLDADSVKISAQYTINNLGTYRLAIRKTDKVSKEFCTQYCTLNISPDEYNTNFVIFNKNKNDNSQNTNYSITSTISNNITINNPIYSTIKDYSDYCFDNSGNVYFTDGQYIYKNNSLFYINEEFNTDDIIQSVNIKYDSERNEIYLLISKSASTFSNLYIVNDKGIELDSINISKTQGYYNFSTKNFAVNNGILYLLGTYSNDNIILIEYNIDTRLFSVEEKTICSYGYDDDLFIGDAIVYKGNLYALLYTETLGTNIHKYGFMLKYSLLSNKSNFLGLNNKLKINATNQNKIEPVDEYDYSSYNTDISDTVFINPVKFIALKPKELYIADDGTTYKTISWDDIRYKNRNRCLRVNLDTFSITDTKEMENIKWFNETKDFTNASEVTFTEE